MMMKPVYTLTPAELCDAVGIDWRPAVEGEGRVTIYRPPVPGFMYSLGADFAYGIVGRDDDTACVMEINGREQVAEVQGKYGERMDRILYALARYYNDAFIVGERQVGLFSLRRLWDEYEYRRLYFERNYRDRQKRLTDSFGHPRELNDIPFRHFRLAVAEARMIIRSEWLLAQMARLRFRDRRSAALSGERSPDESLSIALEGGGSPDLVMAAVYANFGCIEIGYYEQTEEYKLHVVDPLRPTPDDIVFKHNTPPPAPTFRERVRSGGRTPGGSGGGSAHRRG